MRDGWQSIRRGALFAAGFIAMLVVFEVALIFATTLVETTLTTGMSYATLIQTLNDGKRITL